MRFIRISSLVQFVARREIRAEILCSRVASSRGHSCMRMTVEKPDPPVFSYKFQGIFNTSVFFELAEHTETKMIIFTS